jgi:hypothetical protein
MWVPKWLVAAVGGVLVLAILYGGGTMALRAFESGWCGNELIATDSLPGHRYKAIVFVRNCGATTTFGTHISIVEQNTKLSNDEVGNILAIDAACCADPRSRTVPRNSVGGPLATARWMDPDTLSVSYASGTRIFRQTLIHATIHVAYTSID